MLVDGAFITLQALHGNLHKFGQSHVPGKETVELYVVVGGSITDQSKLRFRQALWI